MMIGKPNLLKACLVWIILTTGTPVMAEKLERTVFQVDQMTCNACVAKVYNRLVKLDGYEGLLVNLEKGMIAVDHREKLSPESIAAAMAEIGKPAMRLQLSEIETATAVSATSPGWKKQSDGLLAKIFRVFDF